jgi:outer membrane biosynthesis protein TonB
MLPGRLGLRFALEALFLVLLAVGAGLADLRPALIVLVMGVAWILVAVVEFTAERIAASPTSYLLPPAVEPQEGEPEQVFWPRPEERTVVAPPQRPPAPPAVESEPEPEPVEEQVEEPAEEPEHASPESQPRRRRRFLRRREREPEPEPEQSQPSPPRHVKLLPRRSAPQPSRAAQEVAELFGSGDEGDPPKQEESGA